MAGKTQKDFKNYIFIAAPLENEKRKLHCSWSAAKKYIF